MNEIENKEIIMQIMNKKSVIKPNSIFNIFGSTYVAIKNYDFYFCEKCAFNNAKCNLNIDIPSCANGVHFRLVKEFKLALFNNNEKIENIEKIENNIVYLENNNIMSITDIYKYNYTIKPIIYFQ